jgi:CDP-glucose 4,6-dehydratase
MGLTPDSWHGKKVLVTGHTGFKGSWLCLWLQKLGTDVVGYSLEPPTEPNLYHVAQVESGMTSIMGDIRDLPHMTAVFEQHRPEIVIHMAAQSLVRQSYCDPVETFQTNVMGTVNVLEAARRCQSVKAVLVVTSDKCYENREWIWPYRENEPLGGHDPYSSSKACAELVTAAYRRSFFRADSGLEPAPSVASARAGNVIGGGDWAQDRLVPDCVRAFIAEQPVQLRYPLAVRPWQHVLEPLQGYMTLAQRLLERDSASFAEAWNFGPDANDDATVGEVARRVADLWDGASVAVSGETNVPHEASLLRLDVTKALTRLRWRPRWSLDRALQETVNWYKAWHAGEEMRAYTLAQISTYEERR